MTKVSVALIGRFPVYEHFSREALDEWAVRPVSSPRMEGLFHALMSFIRRSQSGNRISYDIGEYGHDEKNQAVLLRLSKDRTVMLTRLFLLSDTAEVAIGFEEGVRVREGFNSAVYALGPVYRLMA